MLSSQKGTEKKLPLVVIPARNETGTVGEVINKILEAFKCHVVVVDDVSSDDTAATARKAGAHVLPLTLHLGAWGATQTGIRFAFDNNYQAVITIDADGQHSPQIIPELFAPVSQGKADVVIGSCPLRGSWQRKLAWHLFKFISNLNLDDLTSGFRVYNRKAITLLASKDATLLDYQDIGVLLLLQKNGLAVSEVEITMQPRKLGHSHIFSTWSDVFTYMLYSIILSCSRRNKLLISQLTSLLLSLPDKRL